MAPSSRRTSTNSSIKSSRRSSVMQKSIRQFHDSFKCHTSGWDESSIAPTNPILDPTDTVKGYENLAFESVAVPPPRSVRSRCALRESEIWRESSAVSGTENLEEKQARTHLQLYVSKHPCYGKSPVKTMSITQIESYSTFHYQLDSFVEMREISWVFEAWSGVRPELEDEDETDRDIPAPLPWEIQVEPEKLFQDEVRVLQIPHTSTYKTCHRCFGSGSNFCHECKGKGWMRCLHCHGDGFQNDTEYRERCYYCRASSHGFGRTDCTKCRATGKMVCPQCESSGNIVCYIQLTVTWKVNSSEFILEKTGLPKKFVSDVSGQVVYNEQASTVTPILDFPEEAISGASTRLVKKHFKMYSDQNILCQRQRVRVVPVTLVLYEWKNKHGEFFVYGIENKVYAPDYPQTCCWGCVIT